MKFLVLIFAIGCTSTTTDPIPTSRDGAVPSHDTGSSSRDTGSSSQEDADDGCDLVSAREVCERQLDVMCPHQVKCSEATTEESCREAMAQGGWNCTDYTDTAETGVWCEENLRTCEQAWRDASCEQGVTGRACNDTGT